MTQAERKAAWILAAAIVGEGFWVAWSFAANPGAFLRYLGLAPGAGGPWQAWVAGGLVAALYIWGLVTLPAVRETLLRPTVLKGMAVVAAVAAAVLEEVIFRKWIMDYLDRNGFGAALQVLVSGLAFGLAHAFWGLFGRSFDAALHAMVATGVLGAALAVVYLVADRSLAPCIAAHFLITALMEPGTILAAFRGQLGLRGGLTARTGAT